MRVDFAVVGSGAGGGAAAALLTEGGARVAVLEAGEEAKPGLDALSATARYYRNGGAEAAVGRGLLPIPTGVAVGGTTKINSGTCLRPPAELVRSWERAAPGFDAGAFASLVEAAWERLGARVTRSENATVSSALFLQGLSKLGINGGHLLSRAEKDCKGGGRCCFVCPHGAKLSADAAFLEPAKALGLEVLPGRTVTRLERDGGGWRVEHEDAAGRRAWLRAGGVILACGALRTPYLVRRHRLGPNWRRAGDGLSVHPAAKVFAEFDRTVEGWRGVPQGAGVVDPEDEAIRYEGVFTPPELAALTMPLEGADLRRWMDAYPRLAAFGFMIRDEARGRVRYPAGPSLPWLRYEQTEKDLERMRRGMLFVARVLFAAGARRVLLPLNRRDNAFERLEDLEAAPPARAGELQMMAFHPLGTCALGRVVDAGQRLCEGVWAADGSVVPQALGVNPQVTIAAFGLRLAELLLSGKAVAR